VSPRSLLDAQIRRTMDRQNRALEEQAKRSLFDPAKRGVLVHLTEAGTQVTSLSRHVPWKTIHYHRGQLPESCTICAEFDA
jgi:hypothetical protein